VTRTRKRIALLFIDPLERGEKEEGKKTTSTFSRKSLMCCGPCDQKREKGGEGKKKRRKRS